MMDRMSEYTGIDAKETIQMLLAAGALIASVLIALAIIGGWAAIVLYWIVPISLDVGGSLGFIRGVLALGGAIMVGAAYLMGMYAIVVNN